LNRLIQVTKNGTIMAEYGYDPEGYRVVKRAKGETIHYIFEGTEPVFEKRITDNTVKIRSYVYALGRHLARVDGVIGDTEAEIYFYHTDHIGSVRAVTNQAGEVVWNADYLAFGTRFGETTDAAFEEWHGFTGKEYDPDTGLYYYNARWYDADIGRFISEDPARDPNNPNLYVYGRNNPLRFVDPTGETTYTGDIGLANPGGVNYSPSIPVGGSWNSPSSGYNGGSVGSGNIGETPKAVSQTDEGMDGGKRPAEPNNPEPVLPEDGVVPTDNDVSNNKAYEETIIHIYIYRFEETEEATISKMLITNTSNDEMVHGYVLEKPDGNNEEGSRINAGTYEAERGLHTSKDGTQQEALRLEDKNGRTNVNMHRGNYPDDTTGCLLPGDSYTKDAVWNSGNKLGEIISYCDSLISESTSTTIYVHVYNPPEVSAEGFYSLH